MGNCECVTIHSASMHRDKTFVPLRSNQEDEAGFLEVSEERLRVNTMRPFHCQSLTSIKENQLKTHVDLKTRAMSSSNNEVETKRSQDRLPTTISKQVSLKPLKIDPMIFINIKKGKVTENYQIESLLGEGTYGRVLLVTHKKTGLKRALKGRPL